MKLIEPAASESGCSSSVELLIALSESWRICQPSYIIPFFCPSTTFDDTLLIEIPKKQSWNWLISTAINRFFFFTYSVPSNNGRWQGCHATKVEFERSTAPNGWWIEIEQSRKKKTSILFSLFIDSIFSSSRHFSLDFLLLASCQ